MTAQDRPYPGMAGLFTIAKSVQSGRIFFRIFWHPAHYFYDILAGGAFFTKMEETDYSPNGPVHSFAAPGDGFLRFGIPQRYV